MNKPVHNSVFPERTPIGSVINSLSQSAHSNACLHGFYDDNSILLHFLEKHDEPAMHESARRDFVLSQLSKIACEVGEAVDAVQHGEELKLFEELADVIIRTLDLAGYLECDIGDWVMEKMKKNASRPYKHGKLC